MSRPATATATPEPGIDLSASSISDLRRMISAGEEPAASAAATETPEPAAEAAAPKAGEPEQPKPSEAEGGTEPPSAETPAPDSEPGKPTEPDDDEFSTPKGLKKRFRQLTSKIRDLEAGNDELRRELEQARTQPAQPATEKPGPASPAGELTEGANPKPKLEDFESYEAYNEAVIDWKFQQRERARALAVEQHAAQIAQHELASQWNVRVTEAKKLPEFEDFDEVVGSAKIPVPPAILQGILQSEAGPRIAYHLASHPEEAQALVQMDPVSALRALGKLETRFEAKPQPQPASVPPAPKPKAQQPLPKPPATVGGQSTPAGPDINDPKLPMREFKRLIRTLGERS